MAKQTITSGSAPLVWSTIDEAFEKINSNFAELYASVGGTAIGFDALESGLIPAQNDTYSLGSPNKRWSTLYISDTVQIGGAAITNEGLTIDLPSGSTVAGQLIIDPNKAFFKEFSVNGETSVIADEFNDVLDFQEGVGIDLSVNSSSDTIIIANSGVTSLVGGTAMAVSSSTGAVTINNTGVTSAVSGLGISVSSATGPVTFSNSGIVEIESGNITTLTVSARDPVTGKVTITNTKPAVNAYGSIQVQNTVGGVENTLNANSTGAAIIFQEGNGINLIGTTTPNKVQIENSGVLSLIAGNGVTLSSSTGNITVSIGRGDLIGSVFADNSTMIIDGTEGKVVGPIYTSILRTSELSIALGDDAGAVGQGNGSVAIGDTAGNTNQSGQATAVGQYAAQLNQAVGATAVGVSAGSDDQGARAVALGSNAGQTTQGSQSIGIGWRGGNFQQGTNAISIGTEAGESNQGNDAIAIGRRAGYSGQTANSIVLNASGTALNAGTAGFFVNPIRNTTSTGMAVTYDATTKELVYSAGFDGDVTGSVFSDGSTLLVDGTGGKIVGPVETTTVSTSSYLQIARYADLAAITAAIPVAVKGMIVFDEGTSKFRGYDGSSWVALN